MDLLETAHRNPDVIGVDVTCHSSSVEDDKETGVFPSGARLDFGVSSPQSFCEVGHQAYRTSRSRNLVRPELDLTPALPCCERFPSLQR